MSCKFLAFMLQYTMYFYIRPRLRMNRVCVMYAVTIRYNKLSSLVKTNKIKSDLARTIELS